MLSDTYVVDTALVDRLAAAYNAGDADGFAALFSRDAQFVNIFGCACPVAAV